MLKFILPLALILSTKAAAVSQAKGSSLVYGEAGRSESFDPYTPHEASARRLSDLLFDSLVNLTESGEYKPQLATSWVIGPGNTYVDLALRGKVFWHRQGDEKSEMFKPEDVEKTVSVLTNPESNIPNQDRFNIIRSAEKLSSTKIRVRFKRSVRDPMRYLMFKVLPAHKLKGSAKLSRESQFALTPVGTGPYAFSQAMDSGEVVLKANEEYFGGVPEIKKLVMKTYADQSIMAKSLMFNALDLVAYVSPRDLDEIMGDRKLTVLPYDALSFTFFAFNCARGILKDKRVRQAVSHAINRDEMLQAFFQGRGQSISGPFPPTSWAYNISVPPIKFDPALAKSLLAASGLTDRDNNGVLEDRAGKEIKLLFAVPLTGESETVKRMALAFQAYLKNVGLKMELQFMDWSVWKKRVLGEHDYDLTIASWSFDDASNISSLFHSSSAKAYGNNFVNFRNSDVDSYLTEAEASSDFDKKRAIYHKLHSVLADQAPYAYLWTLMHHAAHSDKLSKVQVSPFAFFKHITSWKAVR